MERGLRLLEKAEESVSTILMVVAFGIIFAHIIGRYVLGAPIYFSEEVARYAFIWACMIGASIVFRTDGHTKVDYFVSFLPPTAQVLLDILRNVIIIIFLGVVVATGTALAFKMRTVPTAALEWSWAYVYASAPVGALLMIVNALRHIARKAGVLRGAR